MNREEAGEILREEIAKFSSRPYRDLAALVGEPQVMEVATPTELHYRLEFEVVIDEETKNLKIIGTIDDGGWGAFMVPLADNMIVKPDGNPA